MAAALAFGLLAFSSPNHDQTNTVSTRGAGAEDRTIQLFAEKMRAAFKSRQQ